MKKSAAFKKLCKDLDVDYKEIPEITSFEEACKALNISDTDLPTLHHIPEKHQHALLAHYKLVIIAEALNEGWQPDWNNDDQWKYYPWFIVNASEEKPSGFGLSYHVYGRWDSCTCVGARLCFKSSDLAKYAGKQFKNLYEEYFLLK